VTDSHDPNQPLDSDATVERPMPTPAAEPPDQGAAVTPTTHREPITPPQPATPAPFDPHQTVIIPNQFPEQAAPPAIPAPPAAPVQPPQQTPPASHPSPPPAPAFPAPQQPGFPDLSSPQAPISPPPQQSVPPSAPGFPAAGQPPTPTPTPPAPAPAPAAPMAEQQLPGPTEVAPPQTYTHATPPTPAPQAPGFPQQSTPPGFDPPTTAAPDQPGYAQPFQQPPQFSPPDQPGQEAPAYQQPQFAAPAPPPSGYQPLSAPGIDAPAPFSSSGDSAQKGSGGLNRAVLIGIIALVALAGIGFAALRAFGGESGADTPEGAADNLFDSLTAQDPLGLVEVIDPSEREAIFDPAADLVAEFIRLGLLSDDAMDGGSISLGEALTVETVQPIQYDVDQVATGNTDIQLITVTGGEIKLIANQAEFEKLAGDNEAIQAELANSTPAGDVVTTITFSPTNITSHDSSTGFTSDSGQPLYLAAVDQGQGYYISLWYSVAENARILGGYAPPDLAQSPAPRGADSPEEAVVQTVAALSNFDFRTLLTTLDPEEFAAAYDYWSLYGEDASQGLAEVSRLAAESGVSWDITNIETRTEDANGRKVAVLTNFDLSFNANTADFFVDGTMSVTSTSVILTADYDVLGSFGSVRFELDVDSKTLLIESTSGDSPFRLEATLNDSVLAGSVSAEGQDVDYSVNLADLSGTASLTADGATDQFAFGIVGECLELTINGQAEAPDCSEDYGIYASQIEPFLNNTDSFNELPLPRVDVVERTVDGRKGWYVSGIPTLLDGYANFFSLFEPEDFENNDGFNPFELPGSVLDQGGVDF